MVNVITGTDEGNICVFTNGDLNSDGVINVLDVVGMSLTTVTLFAFLCTNWKFLYRAATVNSIISG